MKVEDVKLGQSLIAAIEDNKDRKKKAGSYLLSISIFTAPYICSNGVTSDKCLFIPVELREPIYNLLAEYYDKQLEGLEKELEEL